MRIQQMTLREIRMPLRERFEISSGAVKDRRILLVELVDEEGIPGWGECVAQEFPNYGPETVETAWLAISRWLAPRLLDREFAGPEEIFPALAQDLRGHLMARGAVEMAAWELAARRRGISLAEILSGTRQQIEVGISLGIQANPSALAERARRAVEEGYRKVKLKIKPGADLEFVQHVRETLGPQAPLAVDANAAYSLSDLPLFQDLDDLGLLMIEQPLAWDDLVRHSQLQSRLRTPLCLDESITGPERAEDMVRLGAGRIINIKPGRVGGFGPSLAIHDFCLRQGIPVWCGGMLETGIGRGHNVALASLPNFQLPGDLSPSSRYWERDIVQPEWVMDDEGTMEVPRGVPGIGVEVDRERIEALTVRKEVLSAAAD